MIRALAYPLYLYRDIVFAFLVVSGIAVPSWLLVRLYYLRTRRSPFSLRREALLVIVVVYLSGLAAATLTPNHGWRARVDGTVGIELTPDLTALTCSSTLLPSGSFARTFCVRNAAGNVALFVPFGVLLPLVWTHLRLRRALLIAIVLSCGIELLQYLSRAWGSYRSADVNDVVLNGVGACLGLVIVSLLRWLSRSS